MILRPTIDMNGTAANATSSMAETSESAGAAGSANAMILGPRRDLVLAQTMKMVQNAWKSFDKARDAEPSGIEDMLGLLSDPLPEGPSDPLQALNDVERILDLSIAQSRPRYLAYVASSGLEMGAIGDLLAGTYDINMAAKAGAATILEQQTIAWLAEFLRFPAGTGSLTSGGTVSNLTALAVARERALPASRHSGMAGLQAAMYCSREVHYSVVRAAEILGIGSTNVRRIAIDPVTRGLLPEALDEAIAADLANGITPVAVVATAGTTLTGSVDPLEPIADICAKYRVWMHVDGAYGLPAASTPSRAHLFAGMERADSVTVDAHKWMFVPISCSALLVRDADSLARVFAHTEPYIPHSAHELNTVDMTLEYSRPFRALKIWLALRVHGAGEMRLAIERNLAQADLCYKLAKEDPEYDVLPFPPKLSIVPIRHVPSGCTNPNAHNSSLTRALQKDGRVYASSAIIDGKVWIRPCFANVRTKEADVLDLISVARELGNKLCSTHVQTEET